MGLAPGLRGANRTGRPFTGDYAGDLLYATLLEYGFAKGVYQARPDVTAVCHHHAPAVMPFCIAGVPIVPVFHLGAAGGLEAGALPGVEVERLPATRLGLALAGRQQDQHDDEH